jgi:hypothetical protein
MAGSTVANKAGGFWLGTFVFAFIEAAFIMFVRKTGNKGENGCVAACGACAQAAVPRPGCGAAPAGAARGGCCARAAACATAEQP